MNLLEHYLQPGYKAEVVPEDESPVPGATFVRFDGKVNCYGNIQQVHEVFFADEWEKVKKQGYYMA